MRLFLSILLALALAAVCLAGPPEPEIPDLPEIPEPPDIPDLDALDSLEALRDIDIKMRDMDVKLKDLERLLRNIEDSIEIQDIMIGGDSIVVVLSNDSVIAIESVNKIEKIGKDNSIISFGWYVVPEDKVIDGNIINIGSDVTVKGTVNGTVMTLGGNIYVTSTGYVQDAIALSGKVKQEAGGQIASMRIALKDAKIGPDNEVTNPYRVMAVVFLIIYFTWLILSATFTSLLRKNVARTAIMIEANPWMSFVKGYLTYLLALAALIALLVSILGIPLAVVGVPVALFACMILAVTALANLIGQRILHTDEISIKTFLFGNLALAGVPGILFLLQAITGSLVIMIFSWIVIGIFVLIIVPFGLGGVLATRFGTREPKLPPPPTPPPAPATPLAPQAQGI